MSMASEDYIERLITNAQKEGKFDRLANQGRPVKVEENPYVDEDWRMAYKVLENGGFAPPWIEVDKEIETSLEKVQRERDDHRRWLLRRLDDIKYGPTEHFVRDLRRLKQAHQRFLVAHADRLVDINKRIFDFNAICPVERLYKVPLQPDRVIIEFDRHCPAIPNL